MWCPFCYKGSGGRSFLPVGHERPDWRERVMAWHGVSTSNVGKVHRVCGEMENYYVPYSKTLASL